MKKAILWVVEVRDVNWGEWWRSDICDTRAGARQSQIGAREHWRFTRIVKYVRELADAIRARGTKEGA